MVDSHRIIAMIPARRGSTRLKQKNLALLNGKPLIYYAISAAKDSGVFDQIVLNSEDSVFGEIAKRYEVESYQRPAFLATSTAKSDEVVNDFIDHNSADIVVWVNSIAPLQTGSEIRDVIMYFVKEGLDSLITVKNEQVHCLYQGKPLNFNPEEMFTQTQDLNSVQLFVYSIMMWRTKTFQEFYKKQEYAILCGKTGYYPVSKLSTVIIKKEEDLRIAEYLLVGMDYRGDFEVKYDEAQQNEP